MDIEKLRPLTPAALGLAWKRHKGTWPIRFYAGEPEIQPLDLN